MNLISDPVLQFLLAGLQQPALASVSATALQSICTSCRSQMKEHFDGLLQIAQAMDSFNLSNDAAIGLLKGNNNSLYHLIFMIIFDLSLSIMITC